MNSPFQNTLLNALPDAEQSWFRLKVQDISVDEKQVLYDQGDKIQFVYFPTTAVVSLLGTLENGSSVEVATVGREGMVGVPIFLGFDQTLMRAVVQCGGGMLRMKGEDFRAVRNRRHYGGLPLVHLCALFADRPIRRLQPLPFL